MHIPTLKCVHATVEIRLSVLQERVKGSEAAVKETVKDRGCMTNCPNPPA